jgi:hypothetical protein
MGWKCGLAPTGPLGETVPAWSWKARARSLFFATPRQPEGLGGSGLDGSAASLQLSTLNFQRSTFNAQLSTLNFQRSTFNAQLSTLNFQRSTFNAHPRPSAVLFISFQWMAPGRMPGPLGRGRTVRRHISPFAPPCGGQVGAAGPPRPTLQGIQLARHYGSFDAPAGGVTATAS